MTQALNMTKISKLFLTGFFCVILSACSSVHHREGEVYDPFEGVNRATFALNEGVDTVLLKPVAQGYRAVTPGFAREGVRNALRNLRTPVNAGNQLLQGDMKGVARDLSRLMINSTIGLAGLIDVADKIGLEHEQEDLGQTLAVWGFDAGPYVVLPLIGPSNMRDAIGLAVDSYVDPVRLYMFNTDQEAWHYVRLGAFVVSEREALLDTLDDLRANSIDYYATMRSAYTQNREALIRDGKPTAQSAPAIPDYDDEF